LNFLGTVSIYNIQKQTNNINFQNNLIMKLTSKNFNLVKIGTVLVKSPEYEDDRDYVVSNISDKFITVKFKIAPLSENKFKTKRIDKKYFTDKNTILVTGWNIKDEEYKNEWNKYYESCGTENWYYAHNGQ